MRAIFHLSEMIYKKLKQLLSCVFIKTWEYGEGIKWLSCVTLFNQYLKRLNIFYIKYIF